jgi:hypothetical protein
MAAGPLVEGARGRHDAVELGSGERRRQAGRRRWAVLLHGRILGEMPFGGEPAAQR